MTEPTRVRRPSDEPIVTESTAEIRRWIVTIAAIVVPLSLQYRRQWLQPDSRPSMVWTFIGAVVLLAAWRRSTAWAIGSAAGLAAWMLLREPVWQPPMIFGLIVLSTSVCGLAFGAVGRRPGPSCPRWPSIVLGIPWAISTWFLLFRRGWERPILALLVGALMAATAVLFPRPWERLDTTINERVFRLARPLRPIAHAIERVFRVLAAIVAAVMFTVIFILTVAIPSVFQRIVRRDPTWAPRAAGSRWVRRDGGGDLQVGDLWLADPAPRAALRRRSMQPIAALALVALVAGVLFLGKGSIVSYIARPDNGDPTPGTFGKQPETAATYLVTRPWFPDLDARTNEMYQDSRISQYVGLEEADIESDHLNIEDGIRAGWTPPDDECAPTRTIWAFGGSTMFGLGQRDEHTIPSELARLAWKDGVRLEIANYGVSGDTTWQQLRRLERELVLRAENPDAVVYYGGFNDIRAVDWSYMAGQPVKDRFLSLNDRDRMPLLNALVEEEVNGNRKLTVDAIDVAVRPTNDRIVMDGAIWQFGAAHDLTRVQLANEGIPLLSFLQPVRATRKVDLAADFPTSPVAEARWRTMSANLPEGVIDLTDALDGDRKPYYPDDVHTLESANIPIATRMWASMKEQLGTELGIEEARACS